MTEEPEGNTGGPPAMVLYVIYALLVAVFVGVLIAVAVYVQPPGRPSCAAVIKAKDRSSSKCRCTAEATRSTLSVTSLKVGGLLALHRVPKATP